MPVSTTTIDSRILGNTRTLWLQPSARPAGSVLFLLDGEYYVDRMRVPDVLAQLQHNEQLPAFHLVYISHVDAEVRWPESFCNKRFADFLADELVPWTRAYFDLPSDATILLGGLSLTGLSAAHAALTRPETFHGALCQSGSFWWEEQRLVEQVPAAKCPPQFFRLVCGLWEQQAGVDHGNGLFQRIPQLVSNQAMQAKLIEQGHCVSYDEYDGGHDLASWKQDLPRSVQVLLEGILSTRQAS